jgi:hypothetical protein
MAVLTDVKHKKQIIRELIDRLAKVDATEPTDATIKVADEPGGHYLLFNNTWKDGRRYYGCFLHIDVTPDGKIWIQHNSTEIQIDQELICAGISPKNIILGFRSPEIRALLEKVSA